MIPYDILWKSIFDDLTEDFIRLFVEDAESIFDFEKGFESLDKELTELFQHEHEKGSLYADKLIKAYTLAGTEEWILIHVEVQGYHDKDFAKRMFSYFVRIFERYKKPVTAFAIFTDGQKNFQPNQFKYSYLGTELIYKYNTFKVLTQASALSPNEKNPFAILTHIVYWGIVTSKQADEIIFEKKVYLLRKLIEADIHPRKIRTLINFLKLYIRFKNRENSINFDEEVQLLTNNSITMGFEQAVLEYLKKQSILEGKEQGKLEGKIEGETETTERKNKSFVVALLMDTDFDDEKISRLVGVTVEYVRLIKLELANNNEQQGNQNAG